MEIQELRYFLALSETLNFTRAAERCNVSQPALTRAIKSLEDKLGAGPLVNRERNNTHLTELGRIMMPYFEQVLGQMEAARSCARGFHALENATLTVGLMCTIGPTRMVDLFANFHRRFDTLDLYLRGPRRAARGVAEQGRDRRRHLLPAGSHGRAVPRSAAV
ncbi:MAG: LysR family transcriptional regulator [Pseudomonadota bacterium]